MSLGTRPAQRIEALPVLGPHLPSMEAHPPTPSFIQPFSSPPGGVTSGGLGGDPCTPTSLARVVKSVKWSSVAV